MTSTQRTLVLILAVLIALIVLVWLLRGEDRPAVPAIPTSTPTPRVSPTPTPTPPSAPPGYRLSGVAVGDETSYAAIENPGGTTNLYRLNAEVPGLGRVARISGELIVIQANGAEFEMWVAPAPTATFTATRRAVARLTPARSPTLAGEPLPYPES